MSAPDDRDVDDISAVEKCSSCEWSPAAIILVEGDWECYNCGHDPAADGLRADGGQPDAGIQQETLGRAPYERDVDEHRDFDVECLTCGRSAVLHCFAGRDYAWKHDRIHPDHTVVYRRVDDE